MKFLTEDKKLLDASAENLVATTIWRPGVCTPP